ncbi:MAG: hypothetical protein FJ087_07400 [Deltaproteobacteria bacterium]|nr:hypothetical protein [Deltaproteobacteria bacterium]
MSVRDGGIGDFELLHAMHGAMRHLTPGSSGGSHTEVFAFESDRLSAAMADLAARHGGSPERAAEAGRRIGRRFLVKVGNITKYVVKLKGGRETVFPRHVVSEAFGPVGYNMAPTLDKVSLDTREAVREIPYFGWGAPEDQFAPDVLGEAAAAVTGRNFRERLRDGVFLVIPGVDGRERRTAWDVLAADPYFDARIADFDGLRRFQERVRERPVDAMLKDRLRAFFDAPMTVGVRDVLRYAEGSRHPALGWSRAEGVIRRCFDEHGAENFLPPEINYYARSIAFAPDRAAAIDASNREAAEAFARSLVERLPFAWTAALSDRELTAIAHGILDLHFDYPLFEVEPYSGVVSTATARFLLRAAVAATIHLAGARVPERRNPLTPALAARVRPVGAFVERLGGDDRASFCNTVNEMLWAVAARGGIPAADGRLLQYRRVDRTFYSFQERAQWGVESRGTVEDLMTLEDLCGPAGRDLLSRRPALARKLVVFFTLVYRYFLDSGHVPDLRPDDAGRDLLLKGIWGYSTKNVLVVAGRRRDGRPIDVIRFVDNKDQFKQYKREEDRERPMGLAKYGLRLVHPLVQPAMERSIGMYAAIAAASDGVEEAAVDLPRRLARVTNQVARSGVDGAMTHVSAFLHDLIDDSTDGIERVLRKL